MPAVTLLFDDDSGAVVTLSGDTTNQETHELSTEITEHPVEKGTDVADHAQDQLDKFTVEWFVSDAPLSYNRGVSGEDDNFPSGQIEAVEIQLPPKPLLFSASAAVGAAISALGSAILGSISPPKANMLTLDDFQSRKRIVLDLLDAARRTKRFVRIVTPLREYDNMLIEQLTVTRAPEDGSGATFTIALKEVRIVKSDVTVAPEPAEKLGQAMKQAGSKSAKKDKNTLETQKKSVLAKGLDAASQFLGDVGDQGIGAFL